MEYGSRFARNTKDCLAAVRELKELGVSVLFEEQGIDTSKVSSEMVTAIMASLAQKGSESISGNVQWGYQKRMRDGTFIPPFLPYGYKTVDKKIYIDEQQAEIVRQIFMSYLSGQSMDAISEQLNASRIPLHTNGADRPWRRWIISYILSNEKYTGDSLWQKTYTTATFPTIQKKNNGERMQYYVENTHPAIISKDIFNAAQKLMRERSKRNASDLKLDTPFRQRMVCGNCGSPFRLRRDRDRTYWSCKLHSESSEKCSISQIDEQEIMATFCRLYYKLKHHGGPIFTHMPDHHEGIVSREQYNAVKAEMARRSALRSPSKTAVTGRSCYTSKYALSDRLVCGECGTLYRRCTWISLGRKYPVWRCASRLNYGTKYCHDSPTIKEEPLQAAILAAINSAMSDKPALLDRIKNAVSLELLPVQGQTMSLADIDRQLARLDEQFQCLLAEAIDAEDKDACNAQFAEILTEQTALKKQKEAILQSSTDADRVCTRMRQAEQALEAAAPMNHRMERNRRPPARRARDHPLCR